MSSIIWLLIYTMVLVMIWKYKEEKKIDKDLKLRGIHIVKGWVFYLGIYLLMWCVYPLAIPVFAGIVALWWAYLAGFPGLRMFQKAFVFIYRILYARFARLCNP